GRRACAEDRVFARRLERRRQPGTGRRRRRAGPLPRALPAPVGRRHQLHDLARRGARAARVAPRHVRASGEGVAAVMSDEHRDELPPDLDVSGYVGQYTFPDIRRRLIPGIIYLTLAVGCLALWATHRGDDHVLVDHGTLVAGVALLLIGWYHVATAWPLAV